MGDVKKRMKNCAAEKKYIVKKWYCVMAALYNQGGYIWDRTLYIKN